MRHVYIFFSAASYIYVSILILECSIYKMFDSGVMLMLLFPVLSVLFPYVVDCIWMTF